MHIAGTPFNFRDTYLKAPCNLPLAHVAACEESVDCNPISNISDFGFRQCLFQKPSHLFGVGNPTHCSYEVGQIWSFIQLAYQRN